jgi:propionyl-CoA carboxylase alpha chain
VFEHEAFRSGNFDTHFVKKYYNAANWKLAEEAKIAGLIALKQYFEDQKNRTITKSINWTLRYKN